MWIVAFQKLFTIFITGNLNIMSAHNQDKFKKTGRGKRGFSGHNVKQSYASAQEGSTSGIESNKLVFNSY